MLRLMDGLSVWDRAVVIGASSGIGAAIGRQLADEGTTVILIARREERLAEIVEDINQRHSGRAQYLTCDVRDVAACENTFDKILAEGDVDAVFYCAGVIPEGGAKGFPTTADVAAIQANLVGAVVWLNRAAEMFQRRGAGTIVGISSVAGERGRQPNPVYSATKAAFSVYLESLHYRLARSGVTVLCVKPGFVRTEMIGRRRVFPPAVSSTEAARVIIQSARGRRRMIYVPAWWRLIAIVFRSAPAALFRRLPI
jgi:decaprenylphospho-beta-D-erythro-pentofuranosid-2-ulose 2-reductase